MKQITSKQIDECFKDAADQGVYYTALMRLAFDDWENVIEVDGWPHVSHDTGRYIQRKAMAFDEVHHPDVMQGGLWMNSGFGSDAEVKDWRIDMSGCQVTRKEPDHADDNRSSLFNEGTKNTEEGNQPQSSPCL